MAGVFREIWTGQVQQYLTNSDKDSFLQNLPNDYSSKVSTVGDEAQAIHLVDMGVLPEVLINNTTYPITVQTIGETDIIIQLDKYQTEVTPITDDELYAMSYDKMATIRNRHGLAIQIKRTMKAAHALAPSGNTAKMPVLLTTGADDGTGRLRCTWEDIARFKTALDNLEIPEYGRRIVLCKDHENDLTLIDQRFKDAYYNRIDGKIYNQLGFDFFDYAGNPYYTPGTKTKLSFGAVPASTDRKATVFFSEARAAIARGWVKMYYQEAAKLPQTQRNEIAFRHNFIVLPTAEEARGAIISNNAS